MAENLIVTVNRQYGSMGRAMCEKLAKKLDIKIYENEIITMASEKSGIRKEYFYHAENMAGVKGSESLIFSLVNSVKNEKEPPNKEILSAMYEALEDVVTELAKKESCIMIDHCAGQILRRSTNCIKVYTCANLDYRVRMVKNMLQSTSEEAVAYIRNIDGKRKAYFEEYAKREWDNPENYDICLNINDLGTDYAADILYQMIQIRK